MLGGAADDWTRLQEVWGISYAERFGGVAERGLSLRVRMLGGSQVGYARMTRRWWAPVREQLEREHLRDAPMYVVSSNTHSLSSTSSRTTPRAQEGEIVAWVDREGPGDLQAELAMFRSGASQGSWENFPLGVAAYNILREVTQDRDTLRGVYVLGKAATLNADVGDVMLSNVVIDEHSQTTY